MTALQAASRWTSDNVGYVGAALAFLVASIHLFHHFTWHLSGHGGFLPGREPLYHGLHPVAAVVSHLVNAPVAALSKLAEAVLSVVLATLYRNDS